MQSFIIPSALALLAGSAIAAPHSSGPGHANVYKIHNFSETKSPSNDITSVFFDITYYNPANGAEGSTTHCVPWDYRTNSASSNWEDGQVYKCAETSFFSFSYSEEDGPLKGRLTVWQDQTATDAPQSGFVQIPTPKCYTADKDQICSSPDVQVTLTDVSQ
ncbi:unnamed protein product [Zymoseptoria tritici ST99CH_3D1]|uniref:AA1-like domain-containing protein n=1 Tax=Zymoseptoria tritici (strain ST99CH_3D7) TaxID=1276538 RepID=A0A1X7RVH6_ZYMT9|nr:unnamed protein product [Zymoseptoria tritici ST99CH_3D7]SMR55881.1 unnamed protein product [Zymoseptoria tritici ST99CH_3D1]